MPKQKDQHAAEASILVRMSNAERDQLRKAVGILNERAVQGGRYYVNSFMLSAALQEAEKVIAEHGSPLQLSETTPRQLESGNKTGQSALAAGIELNEFLPAPRRRNDRQKR